MHDYTFHKAMPGLLLFGPTDVIENDKLIAFDLDHTLIKPTSGKKHAVNASDWMWFCDDVPSKIRELSKTSGLVIFTNQAGIEAGKTDIVSMCKKLNDMFKEIGFGILILISTGYNRWRKPSPAMWDYLIENFAPSVDLSKCSYIGDAAGRLADFSADDYKFAKNCGLKFNTPEEYWLNVPYEDIEPGFFTGYNEFNKRQVSEDKFDNLFIGDFTGMVLMCGPPGCGKSFIARKYFPNHVYICQDTIANGRPGTKAKCISYAKSNIFSKDVIIDKTFPDAVSRKEFIAIALAAKIPVTCIWIDMSIILSKYMNILRGFITGNKVPDIAYAVFQKKFIAPSIAEGCKVVRINCICIDSKVMPKYIQDLVF